MRGPASALTEFLRESGITPTTIARRRAAADAANQPVAGPSNAGQNPNGNENEQEEEQTTPSRRRRNGVNYLLSINIFGMLTTITRLQAMVQMTWTNPKEKRLQARNAS